MSKEYLVLIVDEPEDGDDIEDAEARIYMRFTEEPTNDYLERLADYYPGKRVYCLMGTSTWHSKEK